MLDAHFDTRLDAIEIEFAIPDQGLTTYNQHFEDAFAFKIHLNLTVSMNF